MHKKLVHWFYLYVFHARIYKKCWRIVKGLSHFKQQICPFKFPHIYFVKKPLHLILNFVSSIILSLMFKLCIKKWISILCSVGRISVIESSGHKNDVHFLTCCGWNIQGIEVRVALKQNPDISPKIDMFDRTFIHLQSYTTPLTVPLQTPYNTLINGRDTFGSRRNRYLYTKNNYNVDIYNLSILKTTCSVTVLPTLYVCT